MSDPALEALAARVFATIYPLRRIMTNQDEIAVESARIAVSIRAHLNELTARPAERVAAGKF